MKKKVITLFALIIFAILGGIVAYQKWIANSDHLDFPTISNEKLDGFEAVNPNEYEIYVRPVYSSPYIRCGFSKRLNADEDEERKKVIEYIIDIEKGETIFHAEWVNESEIHRNSNSRSNRSWSFHPRFINNELKINFYYDQYEPFKSVLLPFQTHSTVLREEQSFNEMWILNDNYKFVQIPNHLSRVFSKQLPNSSQFFYAGIEDQTQEFPPYTYHIAIYDFINNTFNLARQWKTKFKLQYKGDYWFLSQLKSDIFLAHNNTVHTSIFVVDNDEMPYRIIDWSERAGLANQTDLFQFRFRTLTNPGDETSLLYMEKEKTVYEVDYDQLIDGSFEETFKPVLQNLEKYPWFVFDHDRFILFQNPDIYQEDYDNPFHGYQIEEHPFAYYERTVNEDGTFGAFSTEQKTITVDETPRKYCYNPLDNEHILYISEGAIWSMKWDGTEHKKLFPKN